MQLELVIDQRGELIGQIHHRLYAHFGQPPARLRLEPVHQLVAAMIGGQTRSEVFRAAYLSLVSRFGSCEAIRDTAVCHIEVMIAEVTFADVTAERVNAALTIISRQKGRFSLDHLGSHGVPEALARIERLPGVGRKVAAWVLNFSTLAMHALVIDTHHLRVLRRLALVGPSVAFAVAFDRIMPFFPAGWSAEESDAHHDLMKRLGQTFCRHAAPHCPPCPLCDLCPTGRQSAHCDRVRPD